MHYQVKMYVQRKQLKKKKNKKLEIFGLKVEKINYEILKMMF